MARTYRTEAVVLAPPYSIQLKREGFPILANTAQYVTIPFSGLGTTLDRIKSNRAQIKKLLKAEIEALRYLRDNPAGTVEVIKESVSVPLYQQEFDALVSLAFNTGGISKFPKLMSKLNTKDYSGACDEFADITNHGTSGLVKRRNAEIKMFRNNVYDSTH